MAWSNRWPGADAGKTTSAGHGLPRCSCGSWTSSVACCCAMAPNARVVTGVDDHSRFCVIAAVVPRATGRTVCQAFAAALARFGIPDEVLTDNGKQFTGRFGHPRAGEVLFDRICRENGITHRLTGPRSPTTTGKIERFHGSLRRELLDDHEPFDSLETTITEITAWADEYNTTRPHQALDMSCPATRFTAREIEPDLPLVLPPALDGLDPPAMLGQDPDEDAEPTTPSPAPQRNTALAIEVDRI